MYIVEREKFCWHLCGNIWKKEERYESSEGSMSL